MEAFSLLNYWKNNSGGGGAVSSGLTFLPHSSDSSSRYSGETTTIVTSVTETDTATDDDDDDDEGPFFDLEFALPVEEEEEASVSDCEFKFTLSSCSGEEDRVDLDVDDVEEAEPPSNGIEQTCSVKAPAAQLSASILKSATKLRVFMLGMRKSKLIQTRSEDNDKPNPSPESRQKNTVTVNPSPESQQKSTVTVNLKVEEVPIISLFTRDNSSRDSSSSSSSSSCSLTKKQNGNESVVLEENRFVMVQKYLKKVKPLYIKVSRKYGEKLKHSGPLSARSTAEKTESPATAMVKGFKPGNININIPAGLKVVRKHLGKSRSSSSTTATTTTPAVTTAATESRRRDDSLLQQQDSIQSAILHCKRSFNSSRDKDLSVLPRSVSEPSSYDK